MKQTTIDSIGNASKSDEALQLLIETTKNGWPSDKKNCPKLLLPYFNFRDEISFENDIAFKGHQIIVPGSMRKSILTKLHHTHVGVTATIRRAKDSVYWPGMTNDI